jgi:hypothetical protein
VLTRALLAICILTAISLAQNPRGALRGAVQDATGARISSAKIIVQSADSSLQRKATSEDRGEFRVDDLPPGQYRITVTAAGFAEAQAYVRVAVSSVRDITVTMRPAAAPESVSIEARTSSITTQPIDLASAVHQGVVTSRDLQTFPLANRSFANMAYLVPGTEPVEPSDPTKARITAVATGGSSGLNNELSVDGADNSDDYIGGFLQNFSPDSIEEFALRTANEDADTGGTTAGSVVITTKRGTNDWHGSAAFYERAAALNARFPIENPAPAPKQPFSRQNYVATRGGPIRRDKVWFFSALEYVRENASIAYSPASVTQFNALAALASQGLIPGVSSIAVPAIVPVPFHDAIGTVRLDWKQTSKSQWFLRVSEDTYLTRNNLVQQGTLPSTGLETHNNYANAVISNTYVFSANWLGTLALGASTLHLTQTRNSDLGFALAFPFSATSLTVSGFETFGDNQFATPITFFPSLRNQEKYQLRYDVSHAAGDHATKFGINLIHEPVLGGAFPGNTETLYSFPHDPTFYLNQEPAVFLTDLQNGASTSNLGGAFSQNVQRLGLYAQDSWRITPRLTFNYGLRYETTFGLFIASGRSQIANPSLPLLPQVGLPATAPHDYRKQFGPRLGLAYSLGVSGGTVIRAGFGLFYHDLAQNGWVTAFQAVNGLGAGPAAVIDPNYKTPYAVHATAGLHHAIGTHWTVSGDYTHEEGNRGFRGYSFPLPSTTLSVFNSDNRSSYNALMLRLQGNLSPRLTLVANYTLASAKTWGCTLGELFDYVNGVCDPFHPFGPGDYGPSGEDVRHRFVLAGTARLRGGIELSTLTQLESARPFTLTTPAGDRAVINGVKTTLDHFRGTPFIQADVRVSRPFRFGENREVRPFAEFFNLFNRNNPGSNYVTDISALPTPVNSLSNTTAICSNPPSCTTFVPITSTKQLLFPAGALGDFFGPGTTVGAPFAAQLGVRVTF